jgi:YfiH family protein
MKICSSLSEITHIRHGFFGRTGGVSEGLYSSLNCGYGSGDEKEKVCENRLKVSRQLGADMEILTCYQIHSAKVITLCEPLEKSEEADALVTDRPGIPIGVLTADCLPVLFSDTQKRIIGAAHAGWKGAIGGVLEATIDAMETLGATDIIATIGPAIAQDSYEVGAEFYKKFIAESAANARFFKPSAREGAYMFDLPGYAKARLLRAGVAQAGILAYDTYSLENEFFSFRRATHRAENVYGRQVSVINLID